MNRVMLGFTYEDAKERARENGWRLRARNVFDDPLSGDTIYWVPSDTPEKLRGIELPREGGIISGPQSVPKDVMELALSRCRL